jgi:carboxypeptidase Taq
MMTAFDSLVDHLKETQLVGSINSLLGWDERTKLPKGGGAYRAEQMTYVSGLLHKMRTDPRVGDWLAEAEQQVGEQDPHSDQATVLREARRSFEKLTKLPLDLVENITRAEVEGQQAWVDARAADDFPAFAPYLKRIIELKREQAEAIGYDDCIYDALMDDFEPGEKTSNVRSVLEGLREDLVPLVEAISESANRPDTSILT